MALTVVQLRSLNNHFGLLSSSRLTTVPVDFEDPITEALTGLDSIDAALSEGTLNAMALDVGGLKVDFQRSLELQRGEGSRVLRALATWCGVLSYFDKYKQGLVDLAGSGGGGNLTGVYVHSIEAPL